MKVIQLHLEYVETKKVGNSDVNVRKGPATSYDAVGVLPKNQAVTVTEVSNT